MTTDTTTSTDDPIPLADLNAGDLLDCLDHPQPVLDRAGVYLIDGRTVQIVGFAEGGHVATGRVAWCRREVDGWHHERRALSEGCEIVDPLHDGPTSAWTLRTLGDLEAVVAWAKGDA
jgi:hypothetical protein